MYLSLIVLKILYQEILQLRITLLKEFCMDKRRRFKLKLF